MFPHHKPIVTVEKELTMICRLCNGAVSETQLISVPVTLTDDVHFPPCKKTPDTTCEDQIVVRVNFRNVVTVSSRNNCRGYR